MSRLWRLSPLVILLAAGLTAARGDEIWQEQIPPTAEQPGERLLDHEPGDVVSLAEALQHKDENCGCGSGGIAGEDEYTIGIERVPFALLEMESAHTFGKRDVTRLRFDGYYDWEKPDRLEYLWATASGGKGPPNLEQAVDFQDFKFVIVRSGPKFQIGTEMGFRSVDPDINAESVGLIDMKIATKTVVKEADNYKAAHLFETTIPTGYVGRGMGTGHVSMENALLLSYKRDPRTYYHAQAGYWFGIAADPSVAGQMWHYGVGMSKVLWDHPIEDKAVIGLLELKGWTITDGGETLFPSGTIADLDPESIFAFHPGLRFILNEKAELGVGGGVSISRAHWYEEMFRIELRFMN